MTDVKREEYLLKRRRSDISSRASNSIIINETAFASTSRLWYVWTEIVHYKVINILKRKAAESTSHAFFWIDLLKSFYEGMLILSSLRSDVLQQKQR